MRRFIPLIALLPWSLAATASGQSLAALTDEFDDPARLAEWSRIYQTEGWGNDALEVFAVTNDPPSSLVLVPHTSSWFEEYRGVLVYKPVTGDFAVTTHVTPRNRAGTGRPERDYSLAGIMVRAPRAMTNVTEWTANGQNYVFLSMGAANRQVAGHYDFEVKTTSNSVSVLDITTTPAEAAAIQVARIGPHLVLLRREDGAAWTVHRRYFRPDFPETLQVGLTVYTDWDTVHAVGVVNNNTRVLTNGAVLVNSSILNNAQPDLRATFDYVRFASVSVPPELVGSNLSDTVSVSDAALLAFLGETVNQPGGAAVAPEFIAPPVIEDLQFRAAATVVSQRMYRLQAANTPGGPWFDVVFTISTGTVWDAGFSIGPDQTQSTYRIVSP